MDYGPYSMWYKVALMQGRQFHIRPSLCCIRCHQLGIMTRMERVTKMGAFPPKSECCLFKPLYFTAPSSCLHSRWPVHKSKRAKLDVESRMKLLNTEARLRSAVCLPVEGNMHTNVILKVPAARKLQQVIQQRIMWNHWFTWIFFAITTGFFRADL